MSPKNYPHKMLREIKDPYNIDGERFHIRGLENLYCTSVLPKLMCRFNAIPKKVSAGSFAEIDNLI